MVQPVQSDDLTLLGVAGEMLQEHAYDRGEVHPRRSCRLAWKDKRQHLAVMMGNSSYIGNPTIFLEVSEMLEVMYA